MKINLSKEIRERTQISRIVLTCLNDVVTESLISEYADKNADKNGIMCDLVLTIDGHEIDFKKFVDHWSSQVNRIIKKEAKQLYDDNISCKFNYIGDLLEDVEERLEAEVDKRLEDWELI